jgi:hypothetical protein
VGKFNIKLDSYVVDLGNGSIDASDQGTFHWDAQIRAFGEGYQVFLYFADNQGNVFRHFFEKENKVVHFFFPTNRFPWCVDLLRNEGPMFVFVSDANPYDVLFTTGNEPVGEGEDGLD